MFVKDSNIIVLCDLPESKKFGKRKLVLVKMDCVEPWGKNPKIRTLDQNIKELAKRLSGDVGQLLPGSVVHVGKADGEYHYRLVDGHRRFAIMKAAGDIEYFFAILYTDVASGTDLFGELFETLNSATRAVNMRERVWLALNNEEVAAGKEAAKLAKEIQLGLSKAAMTVFMEYFCPTHAFGLAKRAFNLMKDLNLVEGDNSSRKKFISNCLVWQIEQNEQESLKHYLEDVDAQTKVKKKKAKLETLQECIDRSQPFPAGSVKGKASDEADDEEDVVAALAEITGEDEEESNVVPIVRKKKAG